jgi:hypothetical protein
LRVEFNGRQLFERSLPDDGELHDIVIADAAGPYECGHLTYTLTIARALLKESWVNATRTEIYFPRFSRH